MVSNTNPGVLSGSMFSMFLEKHFKGSKLNVMNLVNASHHNITPLGPAGLDITG